MILSTRANIEALRTLTRPEQLEACARLIETGKVDYFDACDAYLAVGGDEQDLELLELAARGRLADLRERYES